MYRWPLDLTALSLGRRGAASEATIEITPRGAAFTLASLSHVGHAAHLALVDACLKGQVRGGSMGIGQDSRAVVASLAAPLVAAYELGLERLTLSDLVLLPPDRAAKDVAGRTATGEATRSADCARFLLRVGERWHWLRGAERFEVAGCAGTPNIGVGEPWHDVIAELPDASEITAQARAGRWPAPILAEVRAPSGLVEAATPERICELRGQALASFARAPVGWHIGPATSPADLGLLLPGLVSDRYPYLTSFAWHDATVQVVLTPEPDGYQTLCLLPPPDVEPSTLAPLMLDATNAVIVGLIGRPLAERRTEPFALRMTGPDRSTTLDVGESIVIVRNQTIFAAWVGSDGRVMLRLLPPGGMPARAALA